MRRNGGASARWRCGVLVAALLTAACTASSTSADDVGDGSAVEGGVDTAGDPSLGELTKVTGTLTAAEITGALDGPVTLPLVLTVASRGGGNGAVITGISTAGGNTVVWDGGRPITLSGDGTVAVQPGAFFVRDGALVADLSGAAHALSPGTYRIDGPVAVGDGGGLAAPSTQTGFTAGDGAVVSGTGQVEGRLAPGTWSLLGPGRVRLVGELTSYTAHTTALPIDVTLEQGSFELTLTVSGSEVRVEALLDGEVFENIAVAGTEGSGG